MDDQNLDFVMERFIGLSMSVEALISLGIASSVILISLDYHLYVSVLLLKL